MFKAKNSFSIFLIYSIFLHSFIAWPSEMSNHKKRDVKITTREELSEWLLNRYPVHNDPDLLSEMVITATKNPLFKAKLRNGIEASKYDRSSRTVLFASNACSVLAAMGESFANMDFRDVRIPHANFSGSDLTHANFMGADISHANFNGANLSHANLQGANVSNATFVNTNLAEADFAGAIIEGAILFQQDQNQQQLANQGHRLHVNAVRFSPNQQTPLLVSAGNDAQICVWDQVTGQQIRCWQPHHSAILSLDFSVDGHLLVSASADKTARVHTTQNWQTSYVLQHDAAVTMCRFSKPEETTIACVEGGKTVSGEGAAEWLRGRITGALPKVGRLNLAYFADDRGRILTEMSVIRHDEDVFTLITAAAAQWHDFEVLKFNLADGLELVDRTLDLSTLIVSGPKSRELFEKIADADLSLGWLTHQEATVAGKDAMLVRVSFAGELGWEVHASFKDMPLIYETILEAGARPFGMYALNALRLEKGYRTWKGDLSTDYSLLEGGLDRFVRLDKPQDFPGKSALMNERQQGSKRRFVTLLVDAGDCDAPYMAAILQGGDLVGEVTSGGWGYRVNASIALGMVRADLAEPGTELEVEIYGQPCKATVQADAPLWDPDNERIRA